MTETAATGSVSPSSKPAKAFSCVRCFERKVKCDKEHPCAGCVRSGVDCQFRVPAPPKRRKKRTQEDILNERLSQYEHILQQKGIDISKVVSENQAPAINDTADATDATDAAAESADSQPHSDPKVDTSSNGERNFTSPQLIYSQGKSRFLDNNLWNRVTELIGNSQEALHEATDDEDTEDRENEADDSIDYTLGFTPSSVSVWNTHPPANQIPILWKIFLENVNPFSKIIHQPTLQLAIEKAITNLERLPRAFEALMFAIYSAAIVSMQEREVENTFGESKRTLLKRYRSATKTALARAKFMGSSDLLVLQAFALHLLTMREVYDSRTLWTLSGVALRIAEGMGLHRDGEALGLPPFETEIRRRVWFQIMTIDWRSAELSGSNKFRRVGTEQITSKPPLNINDTDIWPGMKEPPKPHEKVTEMVLCCLRCEFSTFWTGKLSNIRGGEVPTPWENLSSPASIKEKDEAIDELEDIIEQKYVRYCDPSVPIQLMASIVARTATHTMRFLAHHPRRWAKEEDIPESEHELLWRLCMKIMEGYILCVSSKQVERFSWHTNFYFQWQSLIYVLDRVRLHPLMPEADDAWKYLNQVFDYHPHFVTDTKTPIHVAVGNLCLKAYAARELAFTRGGRFLPAKPPEYIQTLRKQRDIAQAKQAERKARAEAKVQTQWSDGSRPNNNTDQDTVTPSSTQNTISPSPSTNTTNQTQQVHAYTEQRPLPPLHTLSLNQTIPITHLPQQQQQQQQQQQSQPQPQQIFPQLQSQLQFQSSQQPEPFWFDDFNSVGSQLTGGSSMDWTTMMMQDDPTVNLDNQMDWSQWDFLLQETGFTR